MKKSILIFSLCFIFNYASGQLKIGSEGGVVANYLKENPEIAYGKSGFRIGLVSNYTLFKIWRIEAGLAYAQKGAVIKNLPKGTFRDFNAFDAHIKYLEIPLSIGVIASVSKDVHFIPKVGVYTNLGLKSSWAYAHKGTHKSKVDVYPPKRTGMINNNYFEQYDFGVTLGFDIEVYDRFACRASYNIGLNTMYSMFLSSPNSKTLNISLGYYFLTR